MLRKGPLSPRLLPALAVIAADASQLQTMISGTHPLEVYLWPQSAGRITATDSTFSEAWCCKHVCCRQTLAGTDCGMINSLLMSKIRAAGAWH